MTEYEEEYNRLCPRGEGRMSDFMQTFSSRYDLVLKYSFAVLTQKAIEVLRKYGPIIEVGSGNGYWAYELRKAQVPIIATDQHSLERNAYQFKKHHESWTSVEEIPANEAITKYPDHTLMMVWPCYNSHWAVKALAQYTGEFFILCGEPRGGCTGTDALFNKLDCSFDLHEEPEIKTWYGIHDRLEIYRRKTGLLNGSTDRVFRRKRRKETC